MTQDDSLPAPGLAEVRITAASPDVARKVALILHAVFAGLDQHSHPAGETGTGTTLQLTVDTTRMAKQSRGTGRRPGAARVSGARKG